jgi:hypothetical protein
MIITGKFSADVVEILSDKKPRNTQRSGELRFYLHRWFQMSSYSKILGM